MLERSDNVCCSGRTGSSSSMAETTQMTHFGNRPESISLFASECIFQCGARDRARGDLAGCGSRAATTPDQHSHRFSQWLAQTQGDPSAIRGAPQAWLIRSSNAASTRDQALCRSGGRFLSQLKSGLMSAPRVPQARQTNLASRSDSLT